jgi:hypothetical protein
MCRYGRKRPSAMVIIGLTGIVGALALTAAATGAAASAKSAPPATAVREADPAALDIVAEQHVSLAQAETRLSWQRAVPALAALLHHRLSSDLFGGIWIDPNDGDRVKIGLVGLTKHDRAVVIGALRATRLAAAADLVPVRYSFSQLKNADEWLGSELVRLARRNSTLIHLDSGYRLDLNRVLLDTSGHLTAAERALVARAKAKYGALVRVLAEPDGTEATPADCSYPFCLPPLRGGIEIFSPNGQYACTGGFVAKSRVDGKLYQFTAGHCAAAGGSGNWWTSFPDHSAHNVGPVHHFIYGNSGDEAILSINNPTGWHLPQGWVYVTANPGVTTLNEEYPINSAQYSTQGARVCKSGAIYGKTTCGVVTRLGVQIQNGDGTVVKNLGEANFCTTNGDSGGPVFASHQAFGLVVAVNLHNSCDSFYQGIIGAENAMNVDIVLAH